MVGFLITNGGTHPPDKWADIMVGDVLGLIQVDENADSEVARAARAAKRNLAPALFDLFETALSHVQNGERHACRGKGVAAKRLADKPEDRPRETALMGNLLTLLDATPFGEHFRSEAGRKALGAIVRQRFASVMQIERQHAAKQEG